MDGSFSDPPRYSEAYPRISIGDAWRGWRTHNSDVLWRNRLGHLVGFAAIDWLGPQDVVVRPHTIDLPYVEATEHDFELTIEYKGSMRDNERPYIVCEGCTRHIDVIIYASDTWRCKHCLHLENRSTLIDPVVCMSEELDDIEQLIRDGRPRNMRMVRYEKLELRHASLLAALRGRPRRSAAREYMSMIEAEWLLGHRSSR